MKKALLILSLIGFIWSCSDKETAPKDNTTDNNNGTSVCDSLNANYTDHIGNILNANCFPCHITSSEAGFNFSTYANAKAAAQNDNFLKAIKHEAGVKPMPQGGAKLGNQTIQYIECWISSGFPEN